MLSTPCAAWCSAWYFPKGTAKATPIGRFANSPSSLLRSGQWNASPWLVSCAAKRVSALAILFIFSWRNKIHAPAKNRLEVRAPPSAHASSASAGHGRAAATFAAASWATTTSRTTYFVLAHGPKRSLTPGWAAMMALRRAACGSGASDHAKDAGAWQGRAERAAKAQHAAGSTTAVTPHEAGDSHRAQAASKDAAPEGAGRSLGTGAGGFVVGVGLPPPASESLCATQRPAAPAAASASAAWHSMSASTSAQWRGERRGDEEDSTRIEPPPPSACEPAAPATEPKVTQITWPVSRSVAWHCGSEGEKRRFANAAGRPAGKHGASGVAHIARRGGTAVAGGGRARQDVRRPARKSGWRARTSARLSCSSDEITC